MILAGDIGGTKTSVGMFRTGDSGPEAVRKSTYPSADHPGLSPIVADFLAQGDEEIEAACFGIAGPVHRNRCRTPNLAWEVDGDEVARERGLPSLRLINDLLATAEGIPALRRDELFTLADGEADPTGTVALLAPGTGLGMSIVVRLDGGWHPIPTEGGHQSFAPRNEEEIGLQSLLEKLFGHVSVERIVSGPGLKHIYEYLVSTGASPNPDVAERMDKRDPAAVISEAGQSEECPVCVAALDRFASILGGVAGDLALVCLATGGVYLGGGIPPKILGKLSDGTFLEAFRAKGRFRELLEGIPVQVIRNQETALLGAALVGGRERNPSPPRQPRIDSVD